jgi:hypothetical protein
VCLASISIASGFAFGEGPDWDTCRAIRGLSAGRQAEAVSPPWGANSKHTHQATIQGDYGASIMRKRCQVAGTILPIDD